MNEVSGYAAYDAYIGSVEWAERRARFFSNHRRECVACRSKKMIHLHHRTYERMGAELDEDLIGLCERCHAKVHALHNVDRSQNLASLTDFVVFETHKQRAERTYAKKQAKKPKPKKTPEEITRRAINRERVAQVRREESRNVLYSVGTPRAKPTVGKVGRPNQRSGSGGGGSNKQAKRLVQIERWKKANGWA